MPQCHLEHAAAGEPVRRQLVQGRAHRILVARDLLAEVLNDRARIQLAYLGSEGVPESLGRLHQLLELDPLLGPERCLPEEIVVPECVSSLYPGRGLDRLSLARRLSLACAHRGEDEESDDFEVPAEGLLGELIREESPAGRLSVVRPLFNAAQHLSNGPTLDVEDGLSLFIAQQSQIPEDLRQPLQVLSGEEGLDAASWHPQELAAASLKRSNTSRRTSPRITEALLPTSVA